MTTSSTYAFNPPAAEVYAAAFGMVGVRRPEITQEHLANANFAANMTMIDFSNRNPNQWLLENIAVPLISPTATYTLPNRTIAIGAAYISISLGGNINDRLLTSMSATEYAAIPDKTKTGFPNAYWLNLAIPAPTITLYYAPDTAYTYILNLVSFRQVQDINPANGQTLDAPYRFIDAFTHGLASRLAIVYPDKSRPNLADSLEMRYEKKMILASGTDQENVNLYCVPGLSGYFR